MVLEFRCESSLLTSRSKMMVIILFSLFLFLLIHPLLEPETDRNKMEYIVITGGLVGNALDLGPGDPNLISSLCFLLRLIQISMLH